MFQCSNNINDKYTFILHELILNKLQNLLHVHSKQKIEKKNLDIYKQNTKILVQVRRNWEVNGL